MIKILPIFILLFTFWFLVPGTNAQEACQEGKNADGLISAPTITGFGNISKVCNQDPSSAFAPYKIPTYDDLKSLYYDQSKLTSKIEHDGAIDQIQLGIDLNTSAKNLIFIKGDLTIDSTIAGTTTAVVFVKGNLTFNTNSFNYGDNNSGIVFVVQDNVYIDPKVTTINAIIISSGFIYTAAIAPLTCSNITTVITDTPLVINGSLISLNSEKPIKFCRTLRLGNTQASEVVNHQVKYLVILRNLLSDTLQRWSEIQ